MPAPDSGSHSTPLPSSSLFFFFYAKLFLFFSMEGLTSHLDAWIKWRASIEPVTPPPTTSTRRVVDSSIVRREGKADLKRQTHLFPEYTLLAEHCSPRCVNSLFQLTPYLSHTASTDNSTESENGI